MEPTRVLDVETTICGQCLWNNEQSVGEGLHSHLCFAFDGFAECFSGQVCVASDLECTGPRNNGLVYDHVVDTPQTIAYSILDLSDSMSVGALDQNRDRFGVLDIFLYRFLVTIKRIGKA